MLSNRLKNLFYRLLIGCLLFSILSINTPSWAQSNRQDTKGEKSNKVTIEEDNPFPFVLAIGIASLIAAIVDLAVNVRRNKAEARILEEERDWRDEEKLQKYRDEIRKDEETLKKLESELAARVKEIIKQELEEFESSLDSRIEALEVADKNLEDEIEKIRRELKEDMINFENAIETIISETHDLIEEGKDIIPKLKEILQEAETTIEELKDKIDYIEVMEKELKEEVESLKAVDTAQATRIRDLESTTDHLKTKVEQEIKTREQADTEQIKRIKSLEIATKNLGDQIEAMKKEFKEDIGSLRAVDTKHTQRIHDLERRKIGFGLATGAWFSQSIEDLIIVYEAQFLIGSKVTLFGGGGGGDRSWISYYGLEYSFGYFSFGVGELGSSVLSKTKLMFNGGISLKIGKVRLNIDYFYVPEEEEANGTRARIGLRF